MALSIQSNVSNVTAQWSATTAPASAPPRTASGSPAGGDGPAAVYTPSAQSSTSAPTYGTRSLSLANNAASATVQNNLSRTGGSLNQALENLSSGLKVNRGADGPASLVISEEQRAQIAGLKTALDNTNKAVSLVQTGEGALHEINSLLTKVRSLALDSANSGINDQDALAANAAEIQNALSTIDNIAKTTQFGGKALLDGSFDQQIQIGANAGQTTSIKFDSATTDALGVGSLLSSGLSADDQVKAVDAAISKVATARASLGAFQSNTLESNANNLQATLENTTAAESVIRDTDFASEIANYTRLQTLTQAGQTVLGNANQTSSLVASLLRG